MFSNLRLLLQMLFARSTSLVSKFSHLSIARMISLVYDLIIASTRVMSDILSVIVVIVLRSGGRQSIIVATLVSLLLPPIVMISRTSIVRLLSQLSLCLRL